MKKLVIIIISLLCVSATHARKAKSVKADKNEPAPQEQLNEPITWLDGGGIKFHIEDKNAPETPLWVQSGLDCWKDILSETEINSWDYNIRTHSATDSNLVHFNRNACFEGFLTAFDKHYSLVLSPDIIWLLISQGISTYINENAEKLRDRLVDFEGQMTLRIDYMGEDLLEHGENLEWIIQAFSDSIDSNMKSQFSDLMVGNFSTTGPVERVTSQITMMESVKKYFAFEAHLTGCGIPNITLLGTPDDWKEIRSRISRLDDLDLKWWRKDLEPVLDEFVNASEGNINRGFWLDMVKEYSPARAGRGGCGGIGNKPAEYNGWFTVFFPFTESKGWLINMDGSRPVRTNKVVTHNTKVYSGFKKADVLYVKHLPLKEEKHNLELWAGFIGMQLDWESRSLKPAMGWMVREK